MANTTTVSGYYTFVYFDSTSGDYLLDTRTTADYYLGDDTGDADLSDGSGGDNLESVGEQMLVQAFAGGQSTVNYSNWTINGMPVVSTGGVYYLYTNDTGLEGTSGIASQGSFSYTALTLSGTSGNDSLTGGGSEDSISGASGNDVLQGGGGNDTLNGDAGNDRLYGGNGNDSVNGGDDHDQVFGNDGNDTLAGGNGNDLLIGGADDDSMDGGAGSDTLYGGDGNDVLTGGIAADQLNGEAGDDTLTGNNGADALSGGSGNDLLQTGTGGADSANTDTLTGGNGDDTYSVHADDSVVIIENADEGNDTLVIADIGAEYEFVEDNIENLQVSSDDADEHYILLHDGGVSFVATTTDAGTSFTVEGGSGDDSLVGSIGDDDLYGGIGVDTLEGGDGNDTLFGEDAGDVLIGGAGDDYYVIGGSGVIVIDEPGESTDLAVYYVSGSFTLADNIENANIYGEGFSSYALTGNDLSNEMIAVTGSGASFSLSGGDGEDTLQGADGDDTLNGGDGSDVIFAGTGNNSLIGGGGDDYYQVEDSSTDTIVEESDGGYDTLDILSLTGNYTVPDYIEVFTAMAWSPGTWVIQANDSGTEVEMIDGTGSGGAKFSIIGGAGWDYLEGGYGDDTLTGGDGNDLLKGSLGNDVLYGDAGDSLDGSYGNDTYHITDMSVVFQDFGGTDTLHTYDITSVTLPSDLEKLYLHANDGLAVTATGNSSGNEIHAIIDSGTATFSIDGGDGNDSIEGSDDNDTLLGGSGNDTLDGGADYDSLVGGAGDDTYLVNSGGDQVIEDANSGHDVVYATDVTFLLADNVEDLYITSTGTTGYYGSGNALDNLIVFSSVLDANGVLGGQAGDDTLQGNGGNDILNGDDGADSLIGDGGDDTLSGGDDNDTLEGWGGDDIMTGGAGDDSINGNSGSDTLSGGSGNDYIEGGNDEDAEDDVLNGDAGDDTLLAGGGNDSLDGGDGNDSLVGDSGNDTLAGGDGIDTISGGLGDDTYVLNDALDDDTIDDAGGDDTFVVEDFSYTLSHADIENLVGYASDGGTYALAVSGTVGRSVTAYSNGGDERFSLSGGAGNDTLTGAEGHDTLTGNDGVDSLVGGDGNDVYELGSDTGDSIVELAGGGFDEVHILLDGGSYTLADNIEQLDAEISVGAILTLTGNSSGNEINLETGGAAGTQVTVYGLDGDDTLTGGNTQAALLSGGNGNDSLVAANAFDTLLGGTGDDTYDIGDLDGSASWAENADEGNDTLIVDNTSFTLGDNIENGVVRSWQDETWTLTGDAGANRLQGILQSGNGNFSLAGGGGADTLVAGTNIDTLDGGDDDDRYELGEFSGATLIDSGGHDTVVVTNDSYQLNDGFETLVGVATDGNDHELYAHDNGAELIADDSAETSDFRLMGGNGNDTLTGGNGGDELNGYGGANSLSGGAGDDTLYGASGSDTLDGGDGDDIYRISSADVVLNDSGTGGFDAVVVYGFDYTLDNVTIEMLYLEAEEGMTLTGQLAAGTTGWGIDAGIEDGTARFHLFGNDGNNNLSGEVGDDTLEGGGGEDTLDGSSGSDKLYGGDGNDWLCDTDSDGNDTYLGGAGNDWLEDWGGPARLYGGTGTDTLIAGSGSDVLGGGDGDDYMVANDGNDIAYGGLGGDEIYGAAGNDTLTGGDGSDTLDGGDGDDVLYGNSDDDLVAGGAGNDTIYAAGGRDTLTGGDDADTFCFALSGNGWADVITDFTSGEDVLCFSGSGSDLPTGTLAASALALGTRALDADDRFIFDASTGTLYYDADGYDGASTRVKLCVLDGVTELTGSDFVIV